MVRHICRSHLFRYYADAIFLMSADDYASAIDFR